MAKVSIIIPSRNERFLANTVADLLSKATGDIEVIAVLDGYWPDPILPDDPKDRLTIIHRGQAHGMRAAINAAASMAKGKYLLKADGHCMFGEGFDEILQKDCEDNWMVIPRRYSLLAEDEDGNLLWQRNLEKTPVDYHMLDCPFTNRDGFQFHGVIWRERAKQRLDIMIDDEMSFQGSCWFMTANHFHKHLHGMSEVGYGTFSQEPQEIGMKTWLGGGEIKVNKNTWYAHLHKGSRYGRGYHIGSNEIRKGHEYSAKYWMNNMWEERVHDIDWLIDKFWPVPTWPENWKELEVPSL